jgi:arylsulfatase A
LRLDLSRVISTIAILAIIVFTAQRELLGDDAGKKPQRPNIVIILADDLGWGSVGCYGADPGLVRTPNIDRLAREGRRFTDASTTSSVCTPTRYSLLTGEYAWRTRLKFETLQHSSPLLIDPARLNLASMLKHCGYRTAAIGKWHLGYGNQPKADYTQALRPGPAEIGFDEHFGVPSNHGDVTGIFVENDHVLGLRSSTIDPSSLPKRPRGGPYLGLDAPQRVDENVMATLTERAVSWIERQEASRPFFLYYAPVAVHEPVTPSAATRGTSSMGSFGDWIHELDRSVGDVLAALEREGLAQQTIVLFTSDNGGVNEPSQQRPETEAIRAGFKPNGNFRGGKVGCYEGGFRVPYIVRWPGHVPAGTTSDEMISIVDTMATVAAIVDEKLPPPTEAAPDSYDLLPAWLDRPHAPIRSDMITHSCFGIFSIRQGAWKYLEGKPAPGVSARILKVRQRDFQARLFDLAADPQEAQDVLGAHPDVVERLQKLLDRQREQGYSRAVSARDASR